MTIPDSVTSIDNNAFYSCMSLADVYYGGSEAQWDAVTIGSGNDALKSANIHYKTLESVAITTPPTKTAYFAGETFDASGMSVMAAYGDGSAAEVTGYTTAPAAPLTISDTTVTVSYTEGGVTASATVNISVKVRQIAYNGSSKVTRRLCELVSELYAAPRLFVDAEGYVSVRY